MNNRRIAATSAFSRLGIGVVLLCAASFAASSGAAFDSSLSALRRQTIGMCRQLQTGNPADVRQTILAEVDSIIAGWQVMTRTYQDSPPQTFASDPAWKNYFVQAQENFGVMREFIERGSYASAVRFCGMNCALFVQMYETNGIERMASRLFQLRAQIKKTWAMAQAGNWNGVAVSVPAIERMDAALVEAPAAAGNDQLLTGFRAEEGTFLEALRAKDADRAAPAYKSLLEKFLPLYLKHL
jgi:hypothetical protein